MRAMARAMLDPESTEEDGAPGGTRTHDLQVRNLTLYPLSYGRTRYNDERTGNLSPEPDARSPRRKAELREAIAPRFGGEGGIRTLGAGYPTQRFSKPSH
jgi:hypothetical protein